MESVDQPASKTPPHPTPRTRRVGNPLLTAADLGGGVQKHCNVNAEHWILQVGSLGLSPNLSQVVGPEQDALSPPVKSLFLRSRPWTPWRVEILGFPPPCCPRVGEKMWN